MDIAATPWDEQSIRSPTANTIHPALIPLLLTGRSAAVRDQHTHGWDRRPRAVPTDRVICVVFFPKLAQLVIPAYGGDRSRHLLGGGEAAALGKEECRPGRIARPSPCPFPFLLLILTIDVRHSGCPCCVDGCDGGGVDAAGGAPQSQHSGGTSAYVSPSTDRRCLRWAYSGQRATG